MVNDPTKVVVDPNNVVDPNAQTPPIEAVDDNGVPYKNRFEEQKRLADEARLAAEQARRDADMLRDHQLRMMAQQQIPPVQQEPEVNDDELNNLFTTNPAEAMRKVMEAREKKVNLNKTVEDTARRVFTFEAKKIEAMSRFPDLKNPGSEFYNRVASFMNTHPEKYQDPEGLLDACARVKDELGIVTPNPQVTQTNQNMRQTVSSAASQISKGTSAPATETTELDAKGLELAAKLGIDPKKMALRMKNYAEGKGEYSGKDGKTGKAHLE